MHSCSLVNNRCLSLQKLTFECAKDILRDPMNCNKVKVDTGILRFTVNHDKPVNVALKSLVASKMKNSKH